MRLLLLLQTGGPLSAITCSDLSELEQAARTGLDWRSFSANLHTTRAIPYHLGVLDHSPDKPPLPRPMEWRFVTSPSALRKRLPRVSRAPLWDRVRRAGAEGGSAPRGFRGASRGDRAGDGELRLPRPSRSHRVVLEQGRRWKAEGQRRAGVDRRASPAHRRGQQLPTRHRRVGMAGRTDKTAHLLQGHAQRTKTPSPLHSPSTPTVGYTKRSKPRPIAFSQMARYSWATPGSASVSC